MFLLLQFNWSCTVTDKKKYQYYILGLKPQIFYLAKNMKPSKIHKPSHDICNYLRMGPVLRFRGYMVIYKRLHLVFFYKFRSLKHFFRKEKPISMWFSQKVYVFSYHDRGPVLFKTN